MAGDWIKMRMDLADDPAVITIADAHGLDTDAVVGKLHRLWSWADKHTKDGNAFVTHLYVDRLLNVTGIAQTLVSVGWLSVEKTGFSLPNFSRHNGKSAKKRCETSQRVKEHRKRNCNATSVTKALPEKRREEKSINTPLPPFSTTVDSPQLRQSLTDWLAYKGKPYKPRGLKALVTLLETRVLAHGEKAVVDAIERAMAQGYKGWDFPEWFDSKQRQQELPESVEEACREWKP